MAKTRVGLLASLVQECYLSASAIAQYAQNGDQDMWKCR